MDAKSLAKSHPALNHEDEVVASSVVIDTHGDRIKVVGSHPDDLHMKGELAVMANGLGRPRAGVSRSGVLWAPLGTCK